jgi:XTP/dITP diphosphohydrolase
VSAGRILLATRSAGKLVELQAMFEERGLDVVDLNAIGIEEQPDEESLEAFDTFEENVLAKARYFHRLTNGMPTMADDSGLEVDALRGAPGVRSKRWAARPELSGVALDEANNAYLLARLEGVRDRRARYVCVAAFVSGERELLRRGEVSGEILESPRGRSGFGYDPLFYSAELGRAFGEVSRAEKERVSHRGRAFRALFEALSSNR